ncbi:MAG: threonine synthase [Clostridiales Family XIII bacterium]|nr:threonine synthase [Clostridiales Family XIII bacterium]
MTNSNTQINIDVRAGNGARAKADAAANIGVQEKTDAHAGRSTNTGIDHLYCPRCGAGYAYDSIVQLCRCGSPLLVKYDLKKVGESLKKFDLTARAPDLWRYKELLPVEYEDNIVSLGEGFTPVLPLRKLGAATDIDELYIKDEGIIPTGTFKARGAAVGVSKAKELGVRTLIMPTNGNAGAAWAIYGARAGLNVKIVMPKDAPAITRNECAAANAGLYLVDGLISDCGKIVARSVSVHGWYDASTLKEPYRIEGKKTMGLEIAEQFGWELPDVILYPTGGGVGLIGIYKALRELRELGWIGKRLPRLVAVQAEGCAPIVKAFEEGRTESVFWENSHTLAFGINVPKALGDFLVLEAIRETEGCAVAASDDEILAALSELAAGEGIFVCPEGAALYAAVKKLRSKGWLGKRDRIVMLNTGAGIKYPDTLNFSPPYLDLDQTL